MTWQRNIIVVVEGATEEGFVNLVLAPFFRNLGIQVIARQVPGGMQKFDRVRQFVTFLLRDRSQPNVTTMFDLYALPTSFPNRAEARKKTIPVEKARIIEAGMKVKMSNERFIPYIQLHEFEALLFSDTNTLAENLEVSNARDWEKELREIDKTCQNPEWINERADKAPSKRLKKHFPDYDKPTSGPKIAQKIGLAVIREKCPHFAEWLARLESLPRNSAD